MARFLKSKQDNIGLSPYDLYFRGEQKEVKTRLRSVLYNEDNLEELELANIDEAFHQRSNKANLWLNIDGLHDMDLMEQLSEQFEIEKVILSEVLHTHNRPKFQDYDEWLFMSAKMLQYNEDNGKISGENLVLLVQDKTIISFQEKVGDVFNPVRERLRKNRKRIRVSNSDYLAFALLDVVIDNYIYIISRLGEKIEDLDDELINNPSTENLNKINRFKSEINYLRKTIKPCREMILELCKSDSELIDEEVDIFLQELKNNIDQANDSVDSYREILSDQLNIFHTNVTYKLNDILKFLTIFSVIFIPITFIAGIYGTNFDYIPELHFKYSYFIMWGVIVATVLTMVIYFKRKKWF